MHWLSETCRHVFPGGARLSNEGETNIKQVHASVNVSNILIESVPPSTVLAQAILAQEGVLLVCGLSAFFFASLKHQCAWVVADGSPSTLQQGGCRSSEDPAHHQCSGHELDSSPVSLFSTVHVSHQRTHKSLADGVRSGPGSIPRR